jgi:hypothetical protein
VRAEDGRAHGSKTSKSSRSAASVGSKGVTSLWYSSPTRVLKGVYGDRRTWAVKGVVGSDGAKGVDPLLLQRGGHGVGV